MLSFTEFKHRKESEKSIDSVFSSLEDDIVGIYINSNRIKQITSICTEWFDSIVGNSKTLREHQIIRNLPQTVKEIALDSAVDIRRLIKKHKCAFLEQFDAIDNAESHIDRVMDKLKDELIQSFGVTPQQPSRPQQQFQSQKPLTWWDRLKRWAKGMWYGPGDPKMRQYAKEKGYVPSDYYSTKENVEESLIDFQNLFEGVIKESVATLVQILNKYKKELLDVVKQAIHYNDALKSYYGSYKKIGQEPAPSPQVPEPEQKPEETDDDWDEIQSDDRIPDIEDAKMKDFPVKNVTPPTGKYVEPPQVSEPEKPEEPSVVPQEPEPSSQVSEPEKPEEPLPTPKIPKEKKPRGRVKGKAYLTNVNDNGDLTFENKDGESVTVNYKDTEKNAKGIPKTVDIGGVPHVVVGKDFKKLASNLLPTSIQPFATKDEPEITEPDNPNETEEEKLSRARKASDTGKVSTLDNIDEIQSRFSIKDNEPVLVDGDKSFPVKSVVPYRWFYYVEAGNKWFLVKKKNWEEFTSGVSGSGAAESGSDETEIAKPEAGEEIIKSPAMEDRGIEIKDDDEEDFF